MKQFSTLLLLACLAFQAQAQSFFFNVHTPSSVHASYAPGEFSTIADNLSWGWDGTISNPVIAELAYAPADGNGDHFFCDSSVTADLTDKIVLIERGTCQFWLKALNAQNNGAVGVIIRSLDSTLVLMSGGEFGFLVNIPVIFITQETGAPLIAEMAAGNTVLVSFATEPIALAKIQGKLTFDENEDCVSDLGEPALAGWKIKTEGNNTLRFATTKADGSYRIYSDTGSFVVSVVPPNAAWDACDNDFPVSFSQYDSTEVNFLAKALLDCPHMTVDIETPFLRRCFDNNFVVNWCNLGTAAADEAYVEIQFDSLLHFVDASIPFVDLGNNTFEFYLGEVNLGNCGSFTVTTFTDCDAVLGQTLCADAQIFPDTICIPTGAGWTGASVRVSGECAGGEVVFSIENQGFGDMNAPAGYRLLKNGTVAETGQFQLAAGASKTVSAEADGATYRLEADQTSGYPEATLPSSTVEACDPAGGGNFSLGFVNQFSAADYGDSHDEECNEVIGSYDPNDKQGFPTGYGNQHFMERNTDIQYLIRFQNTGTDTAFNIFIKDTLSDLLNVASIRPGVASHVYTWSITGENILTLSFPNVMLPDSFVNEPASHGFVNFTISQKPALPLGSVIHNSAGIFFDFNVPVITNETWHTVGENFLPVTGTSTVSFWEGLMVNVLPNPVATAAIFDLGEEVQFRSGTLQVFDPAGKLLREQDFEENRFEFRREGLAAGSYFFKIWLDGKAAAAGKMAIK
ncbi:MAG: PA domain-containing protein [Bacteroidota bacterium]|mgnify:CR=1 FL=1